MDSEKECKQQAEERFCQEEEQKEENNLLCNMHKLSFFAKEKMDNNAGN